MPKIGLFAAALVPLSLAWSNPAPSPTRVAVLAITLNDLANQPANPELASRMQRLDAELRDRLAGGCGYQVVAIDSADQVSAESSPGYLYAHPDLAAQLASAQGADWVIVPRLNRASPWVADLQANVVRVRDATLVSNRIVEVKGIELTRELAARLAERGAAWMADQVSQSIEYAAGDAEAGRRCPA